MRTVARFVTRPTGDGRSDIILGALMAHQEGDLKPNTVYEIYDCLGVLGIREVGESLVSEKSVSDSPIRVTWCQQYQDVGIQAGKYLLISRQEYEKLMSNQVDD